MVRYANHFAGDATVKSHTPRLSYSGSDRWKETQSGLRDMRYDRWWEVALQIQEAERRTRA